MVLVIFHYQKFLFGPPLLFGGNIYRQQAATFSALA
jgi:hypothetical protein